MNTIKTLIFIPAFERYEVAELCYKKVRELMDDSPDWIELDCLVVGSTMEDIRLASSYNFFTVIAPNEPLGRKKNQGVVFALKQVYKAFRWDYLLELDSDGVIIPALLDHYKKYFDNNCEFFGCNRICFYHAASGRALDYTIINGGVWVTGRVISHRIVKHMDLGLWHPGRTSGLGMNMEDRIMDEMDIRVKILYTEIPLMLDIKTGQNISQFESLANNPREAREVKDRKEIETMLGRFGVIPIGSAQ